MDQSRGHDCGVVDFREAYGLDLAWPSGALPCPRGMCWA